jgi:hypothetical protein|tara:strand:+ start:60 stop:377 length:318 start_codon:yes stop_codon:yes gene_type:complete
MKNQGEVLRDEGIKQSIDNANKSVDNWGDKAYAILIEYIRYKEYFMTEDIREYYSDRIEEPPSNRAWGAVVLKAKRNGLIKSNGFSSVKNPKAHKTPATLWKVIR